MELRQLFTRAYVAGGISMTDLCEHYGISRKTGYKWIARFEARSRTLTPLPYA